MSKSKKQQRSWIPIEECDRVSSLPDSIICHIFSPFSQPKTPSPQAFSQRDGNHTIMALSPHSRFHRSRILLTICSQMYSVMLSRDNTLPILSLRLKNPMISLNLLLQQYKDELKPLNLTCEISFQHIHL